MMLSCAELELRIYDEDCRAALLRERAVPGDVARHLEGCDSCRLTWSEAATVVGSLREALTTSLPPKLCASLYGIPRRARTARWAARVNHVSRALSAGAIAAAATAAVVPTAGPWHLAVFAGVGGSTLALRRARAAGFGSHVRRLLRRAGSMLTVLDSQRALAPRRSW